MKRFRMSLHGKSGTYIDTQKHLPRREACANISGNMPAGSSEPHVLVQSCKLAMNVRLTDSIAQKNKTDQPGVPCCLSRSHSC